MTDAPERIWVEDERPLGGGVYVWNARNNSTEEAKQYAVEYIRADLVAALEDEIDRLREALEPFAYAAQYCHHDTEDDYSPSWALFFICGDFRRARAALNGEGET